MLILFWAAIIPVIVLCIYINKKDKNKEPFSILIKMFLFGAFSIIPVALIEVFIMEVFGIDTESKHALVPALIYTFFGIAIIEEFFKWLVVRIFGYNSKHFDEVYDIIVYSSFAALGFACFENKSVYRL